MEMWLELGSYTMGKPVGREVMASFAIQQNQKWNLLLHPWMMWYFTHQLFTLILVVHYVNRKLWFCWLLLHKLCTSGTRRTGNSCKLGWRKAFTRLIETWEGSEMFINGTKEMRRRCMYTLASVCWGIPFHFLLSINYFLPLPIVLLS